MTTFEFDIKWLMISAALVAGWNRLPLAIKDEEDAQKAKQLIKKLVFS